MQVSPSAGVSSAQSQVHGLSIPPLLPEADTHLDHPSPSPSSAIWRLNLDVNYRVGTDSILQWPVFKDALSSLRQYSFLDFRGTKALTHLNDAFNREESRSDLLNKQHSTIHISTERADIEQLVEQFFTRVHVKNPILTRRLVEQYCLQYYENGALFNLETCLVLIVCALGAVATEFLPSRSSSDISSENVARLESLRMGNCYFSAAEKRLGAAISCCNTLAVQCLCLAGYAALYSSRCLKAPCLTLSQDLSHEYYQSHGGAANVPRCWVLTASPGIHRVCAFPHILTSQERHLT